MLAPLLNVSRRESSTALHDDSLRKHPRIGSLSVGIASLNRRLQMDYPLTGKGFVSFGDRARSRREDVAKLCFALNVGTLLCDVSWESTRYANVPKARPYILAVLQHPPWCGERSFQFSEGQRRVTLVPVLLVSTVTVPLIELARRRIDSRPRPFFPADLYVPLSLITASSDCAVR